MPKTPDYFAGKTIIITGAASGIGRATALIFAREGANVVCTDLNETGAKETAAQVNGKGSQALALKTDVTRRKEVEEMAKRAIDAFGTVQFLFNSAGAAIRRAKGRGLDLRELDHFRPSLGLIGDEFAEFAGDIIRTGRLGSRAAP